MLLCGRCALGFSLQLCRHLHQNFDSHSEERRNAVRRSVHYLLADIHRLFLPRLGWVTASGEYGDRHTAGHLRGNQVLCSESGYRGVSQGSCCRT